MVTWTINRAFLLELKDSNPDYWTAHNRLGEWLSERAADPTSSEQCLAEVVPLIRQVRDELKRQFMLEETYGYLQTPVIHSLTFPHKLRLPTTNTKRYTCWSVRLTKPQNEQSTKGNYPSCSRIL